MLDSFAVCSRLEVVRVHDSSDALNTCLVRVVCVLRGDTHQVLPVALDLNSMSYQKAVFLRFAHLYELAVVHARMERVHADLFEARVAIVLPGHALVNIAEVLNQFSHCHLPKLGLESHEAWIILSSTTHAIHFDSLASLLFKLPVGAVEHVDELVCSFPS